jgi:dipeptide/tripeptide permease
LGHPVGLYVLFFTEMWERFSYYGMRALLILYMVNYFRYEQKEASSIYKIYTSLVYVTPILGGYLADRFLGNKRAVIIGAILMAIGQFMLTVEDFPIFIGALVFLIIGNGFFKPNMSTQVGRLYPPNDGRLDSAYTIFYMGINLGACLAPLVCGWLAENTVGGHHTGFAMAGIGMVCGLLIYLFGQPWVREIAARPSAAPPDATAEEATARPAALERAGPPSDAVTATGPVAVQQDATRPDPPVSRPITEEPVPLVVKTDALTEHEAANQPSVFGRFIQFAPPVLYVLAALLFLGGAGRLAFLFAPAVTAPGKFNLYEAIIEAFNPAMLGLGGSLCLFLIGYVAGQVRLGLRDRVLAILVLGIFVMIFWLAAEQAGNVLNIWADKNTDRYLTQPMTPAKWEKVDVSEAGTEEEKTESSEEQSSQRTVARLKDRFLNMFRLKPAPVEKPEPRPALGAALGTTSRLKELSPPPPKQGWLEWALSFVNPMSTPSFQAINPLAIFVLAPLFAWLWIKLDRKGIQPSIPMKMVFGLALMCLSVVVMIGAAKQEGKESSVTVQGDGLPVADRPEEPAALEAAVGPAAQPLVSTRTTLAVENGVVGRNDKKGKFVPFHAGLLTYDEKAGQLSARGALPDTERDVIVGAAAPAGFVRAVKELKEKSQEIDGKKVKSVEVVLPRVPAGFDMKYSGIKGNAVTFDAKAGKLIARKKLAEKEEKGLLVAAGEPNFRATVEELYVKSNRNRVSLWWLFWSYILATLGELCLSPVGLSMVSKLAPAKFATMMMGVWMLTSAFGNFAAGALGESWGTTTPVDFFFQLTLITGGGTLVLLLLVKIVTRTMHGVK